MVFEGYQDGYNGSNIIDSNGTGIAFMNVHVVLDSYEGCSNMNASSFITFFTYLLGQNVIPFWKELFLAFQMAPNKRNTHYFSRVTDPYIKAALVY